MLIYIITMKHIQILFLLMLCLGISKNVYCVNLFESKFIKIEIETNNAYETKLKSIEEIKIKSLEKNTYSMVASNKYCFTIGVDNKTKRYTHDRKRHRNAVKR